MCNPPAVVVGGLGMPGTEKFIFGAALGGRGTEEGGADVCREGIVDGICCPGVGAVVIGGLAGVPIGPCVVCAYCGGGIGFFCCG